MSGASGKNRRAWLTPDQLLPDAGTFCRHLSIPNDPQLIAATSGALHELTLSYNWEQHGTMTPEEAAKLMDAMLWEYFHSDGCENVPAPYWDDADGDDADGDEESSLPWYEDLADWVVTAFLATSFTPEAAINFVTTARKLRLWFRTRDYGAIVRVLLDGLEIGTVDTYSLEPGIVEFAYDIPEPQGLSAQSSPEHELRLEHTGTANANAVPAENGYAVEVVRKHIEWSTPNETDCPYRLRYNADTDTVERFDEASQTWQEAAELDPRQQYQQPPVDTSDPRCDAAARMTAEIRSLVEAGIENVENVGTAFDGAALIIAGLSLISGINLFFSLAVEVASGFLDFTAAQLHNEFDEFDWDAMTCEFYCRINEEGRLDEAGMADFVQNYLNTLSLVQSALINLNMLLLGWGGLSDYAALRSEVGDCDECEECEWQHGITPANEGGRIDFSVHEWSMCNGSPTWGAAAAGTVGEYQGITRWLTTPLSINGVHGLRIRGIFDLPAETTVTSVSVSFGHTSATNPIVWKLRVNATQLCNPGATNNVVTINGTWTGRVEIEWTQQYNQGLTQGGYVNGIQITGTGRNPFLGEGA